MGVFFTAPFGASLPLAVFPLADITPPRAKVEPAGVVPATHRSPALVAAAHIQVQVLREQNLDQQPHHSDHNCLRQTGQVNSFQPFSTFTKVKLCVLLQFGHHLMSSSLAVWLSIITSIATP